MTSASSARTRPRSSGWTSSSPMPRSVGRLATTPPRRGAASASSAANPTPRPSVSLSGAELRALRHARAGERREVLQRRVV
eukprot:1708715-Prymnesium_polylepis.1